MARRRLYNGRAEGTYGLITAARGSSYLYFIRGKLIYHDIAEAGGESSRTKHRPGRINPRYYMSRDF